MDGVLEEVKEFNFLGFKHFGEWFDLVKGWGG